MSKEEKALFDKLQTRLGIDGKPKINDFKFAKKTLADIIKDKMLICPFCLTPNYLSFFSYEKGFYKCKNCLNKMTDKTLLSMFEWFNRENIDYESYAKWVFNYRMNGFFQKIKFKEWCKKLHDLCISYDFWNVYNRLKGEYKRESEEDS